MAIDYLSSFNSGELSEKMNGRTDLDLYRSGCRRLENFYVLPQGGVERRTGTKFLAGTKNDSEVRLIPFTFSADQSYAVEFGAAYARFYDTDGTVASDVVTPYALDNVRQLQYAQRYDLMFLVNGADPVQVLSRTSITPTFSFAEIDWEYPPLLDQNDTATTITPSGTTGSITLTASTSIFDAGHVGSYWRIRHERTTDQQSIDQTLADGSSPEAGTALDVSFSNWKLTTGGTWNGYVELQKSTDGGSTWERLAVVGDTRSTSARNYTLDSENPEDVNTQIRVYWESKDATSGDFEYNLYAESSFIEGLVEVTAYTSGTEVTATVLNDLASTDATKYWTEGAFSDYRGHPRTVTFHEDRLWFCGTDYEPATIYASVSGDYFNFQQGTQADSSIRRVPESPEVAEWMASKKYIALGTSGGAMTIESVDDRENINVETIKTPSQSEYGSEYIQALLTNDVVVYVQKNGRKVREMIYNWEEENYRSNDITILSEQITSGGIVEAFLQKQPDQIVHCVKGDGDIAALTYERPQEVVGWGNTKTNGDFISGCATSSADSEDNIFTCVLRNGQYNIEVFQSRDDADWYVDGGVRTTLIDTQDVESIEKISTDITVSGAGTGGANGVYTYSQQFGGYPLWRQGEDGPIIYVNDSEEAWLIEDEISGILYVNSYDEDAPSVPPKTGWTLGAVGASPAPTLSYDFPETITGIGSEEIVLITATAHGLLDGDTIEFKDVGGMEELNEQIYTVADKITDAFVLKDETDSVYVDGTSYGDWTSGGNFTQVQDYIDGLDHLDGTTVQVMGDGSYIGDFEVSSGTVQLETWANDILAGLQFVSYLQPMFLEPILGNRRPNSRKKAVSKCSFKVYNTIGLKIGPSDKRKATVDQRTTFDITDEPLAVQTGEYRAFIANDWKREKEIEIEQSLPYPLTVLSMAVWTRVEGG